MLEMFSSEMSEAEVLAMCQTLMAINASKIDNKPMQVFLKILINWKDKVLNFFQDQLSNGLVEGLNNAIRGVIRRSFGFHNFENRRRRVLLELG